MLVGSFFFKEGVYAYNGDWIGSRVATAMLYVSFKKKTTHFIT